MKVRKLRDSAALQRAIKAVIRFHEKKRAKKALVGASC